MTLKYEAGYLRTVVKGGWKFFLRRFVRIGPICLKPYFWAFWDITTHARNLFGWKIPSELGDTGGGSSKVMISLKSPMYFYIGILLENLGNQKLFNFHQSCNISVRKKHEIRFGVNWSILDETAPKKHAAPAPFSNNRFPHNMKVVIEIPASGGGIENNVVRMLFRWPGFT